MPRFNNARGIKTGNETKNLKRLLKGILMLTMKA